MKARVALLASIFSLGLVAMAAAQVSTVEGTVVSNSGGVLVIDTDSGQRTFMVDAQSSLPADLAAGSRVRVEYHTLANDKFHAFKVSSLAAGTTTTTTTDTTGTTGMTGTTAAPTAAAPPDTTTTTAPVEPTADTRATGTTTGTMQERPVDKTTTTTTDTTTQTTDTTTSTERTLPATASPLPLLALAGGLAMAGGALLRRLR